MLQSDSDNHKFIKLKCLKNQEKIRKQQRHTEQLEHIF